MPFYNQPGEGAPQNLEAGRARTRKLRGPGSCGGKHSPDKWEHYRLLARKTPARREPADGSDAEDLLFSCSVCYFHPLMERETLGVWRM